MNVSKRNFNIFRSGNNCSSNWNNIDYEFENEKNKDTIIKLKDQIIAKDKEISELKFLKNNKDEEYEKTIKVLEEIINQSTPIEENNRKKSRNKKRKNKRKSVEKKEKKEINEINENDEINENNENNINNKNKEKDEENLYETKNSLNCMLLNIQLESQNNILAKKEKEIKKLKQNPRIEHSSKLTENFIQNTKEYDNIEKENEIILTQQYDIEKYCTTLNDNNKDLLLKIEKFNEDFKIYKESQSNKLKKLEEELKNKEENESNCKLFHRNKGKQSNNNEVDKVEKEIKKMNKTMDFLRKETKIKNDEIEDLNIKIQNIYDKNNELKKQLNHLINLNKVNESEKELFNGNEDIKNKINNLNEQLKQEKKNGETLKKKMINLEKENKELKKNVLDLQNNIIKLTEENTNLENKLLKEEDNNEDDIFFTTGINIIKKRKSEVENNENLNEENN